MRLDSIDQVEPDFIKDYRKSLGMPKCRFWGAIGCSETRGLRYESGASKLPETVKRLLFLQYGVGIPTDCKSRAFRDFENSVRSGRMVAHADELVSKLQRTVNRMRGNELE